MAVEHGAKQRVGLAPRRGDVVRSSVPGAVLKRLFDLVLASLLLVLLAPAIAVIAIAIRLEGPGDIFFRCIRVGYHGRELEMLKFRKMHHDAAGPALTTAGDERFTRIGRLLARTKLDELPQLWNVVKGDMSLVGPRPESPDFVERHPTDYDVILRVKPGITGLCQLAFAEESEILDPTNRVEDYLVRLLPQKAAMDRLYAERRSLLMDLRILLWTGVAVLARQDVAVDRKTGRLGRRRRPNGFKKAAVTAPAVEEPAPSVVSA